jgi:hypothetical protein
MNVGVAGEEFEYIKEALLKMHKQAEYETSRSGVRVWARTGPTAVAGAS